MSTARRQVRSSGSVAIGRGGVVFLAGAAILACVASAMLLMSFSPQSPLCGPGCLEMRLQDLAGGGQRLDASRYEQAERLARSQLAFSPVDTGAWLRLAALESRGGPLDAQANAALLSSYRFMPVDAVMARWRLAFLFEHWSELTPQLRSAAIAEIHDLMLSPANIDVLRQIQASISNPSGQLACRLLIDGFSRS